MITINGAFLTSIGVVTVGNTFSASQQEWHTGLVMSNGTTVYNRYDFFLNSPVNGEFFNNQLDWYRAIGLFHSEPIYDQFTYMQNVSFDGVNVVGNQWDYYRTIGSVTPGGVTPSTVANFTVDDATAIVGQVLTFTDTSTNTPDGWTYSFGETASAISNLQNPTFSYSGTGSFTVSLTASNTEGGSGGTDNETKVNFIEVGVLPIVEFILAPDPACTGEVVSFTSSATASSPTFAWDFNDGATASTANATHSYSATGSFIIGLTATDNFGSDFFTQSITVNTTPSGSFTSSTQSTTVDTVITFTDTSTETPTAWDWNFADGATSSLQNPTHSYSATGSFIVGMTPSNACGDGTFATASIEVTAPPFQPDDVAGLDFWLTATDQSTVNGGDIIEGGTVSSWLDKSTNAFDLVQGTAADMPTWGATGVFFDGVSESLEIFTTQPFNHNVGMVWFSGFTPQDDMFISTADLDDTVSATIFNIGTKFGGEMQARIRDFVPGTPNNTVNSTNAVTADAYFYGYIASNGATYSITLNGVTETVVMGAGSDDGSFFNDVLERDNIIVGALHRFSGYNFFDQTINKIVIFDNVISEADITSMQTYMSDPLN